MRDMLKYEYGRIPEKNRKAIEALHEQAEKIKFNISNSKAELDIVKHEIVLLLTYIRPGDLVKHDAEAKYLRKAEVDKVYLVTSVSLGYSGLKFMGRKIKKDGQPTDRDTELYVGIDGRLIKIGRYRRRRAVCTTSKG